MATHKPFRFGVEAGDTQSRAAWVAYARKVEDLGYSTLIIGEHPSWGGITPTVGLMAAADATTTQRLGSHVFANDFQVVRRNKVFQANLFQRLEEANFGAHHGKQRSLDLE